MHGIIRTIAIVGCLALSAMASERPGDARESDSPKRIKLDRELTKKIQKAVAHDDGLQESSRKVDVSVQDGVVTLKGAVQSDAESQEIQGKAESLVTQATPDEKLNDRASVQVNNELVVNEH